MSWIADNYRRRLKTVWRRILSTEPVVFPFSNRAAAIGVSLVLVFVAGKLIVSRSDATTFNPRCGAFGPEESKLIRRLNLPVKATDAVFEGALRSTESEGSFRQRHSARLIRLQCGLVRDRSELIEATGLQVFIALNDLSPGMAPFFFSAATRARDLKVPLAEISTNGRFDVVALINHQLAQPVESPPSEFDAGRAIIPGFATQITFAREQF